MAEGQARRSAASAAKKAQEAAKAAERAQAALNDGEGVVEGVVHEISDHAPRVNAGKMSGILGDTGMGFLALSISVYSAAWAVAKFQAAYHKSSFGN